MTIETGIYNGLLEKSARDRRALLIVNPKAGNNRSMAVIAPTVQTLTEAGYVTTAFTTTCCGDATRLVERYAPESQLIVCSGGDGTMNEIVRGCMRLELSQRPPIGYIPAGSTNDFAAALQLPKRADLLIDCAVNGRDMWVDVGCFNGRHYAYLASCGAFTDLSGATPQEVKNRLGFIAYLRGGMASLAGIQRIHATVISDGVHIDDEFAFIAVSNTHSIIGLINYDESQVNLNDGMSEILLIRYPENALELANIVAAMSAGDFNSEYIYGFSAREVKFLVDTPIMWILDGETQEGTHEVTVKNCHSAVRIRVPQ